MTGVNQTCANISLQNAADMGCDLVKTTAHHGARPEHMVWQGRVFSISGKHPGYAKLHAATGYGTGAGLCGWNCRHSFYPFFEGLSSSAYPREKLREYENKTVSYKGEEIPYYDATQQQRGYERELVAFDEMGKAGDTAAQDKFNAASVKLKRQEAKLRDFVRETGLQKDASRTQVREFGRSASGKAVWANRKGSQYHGKTFQLHTVTQESIDKIQLAKGVNMTEVQALNLQQSHKQLLKMLLHEQNTTEAGTYLDENMKALVPKIGNKGKISLPPPPIEAVGTAHTHPSGETFSLKDVSLFTMEPNLSIMTAVGNNG